MRKTLKFLMLALIATLSLMSCKNGWPYDHKDNYDTSDSAMVAEYVNSVVNPSIMDVKEALSLKSHMIDQQVIDSLFIALPNATIENVVCVLQKKTSIIHKKDIVEEYLRAKDVYTNLPIKNVPIEPVDKTGTDLGQRQDTGIISTSYNFRTDTINGKPVKIRITTTESYEK